MGPHAQIVLGELYYGAALSLRELRTLEDRLRSSPLVYRPELRDLAARARDATFELERAMAAETVRAMRERP
jgi:hypothetical protein